MKKKEMKTKVMAVAMSATMAASICPAVPAMAVTKDQVAKDGTYSKDEPEAHKNRAFKKRKKELLKCQRNKNRPEIPDEKIKLRENMRKDPEKMVSENSA